MKQGDIWTRRQSTCKLFIQPAGETGYVSFGDIMQFKFNPDIKRTPIVESDKGFRRRVRDIISELGWLYEVTLTEQFGSIIQAIHLAKANSDVTQAHAATQTIAVASVKLGRSYVLAKHALTGTIAVVKHTGGTALVDGTDYTLDADAGILTILPTATVVVDNDAVDVTCDVNHSDMESYSAQDQDNLYSSGDVLLDEFDQFSGVPIARHTFTAQYYINDRGTQDGNKPNTQSLVLIAQTKPLILVRKALPSGT